MRARVLLVGVFMAAASSAEYAATPYAPKAQNASVPTSIPVADLATGASCACTQLNTAYNSLLVSPESANYTTECTEYWDRRSNMSPACIFLPETADQVAAAVGILASCGAQFAIRGGGHMNFPGSNSIEGGVTIALGKMINTKVASDNSSIEYGPGARWVDVYGALAPYGLYSVGGRLKTIGAPGLTLIGGFHWLINKYGFTMDQILSYDVVLGNGTQVVASAQSHPDLFWALKGGANNFGIVTKFTMKAYPIPQISTTVQYFAEPQIPAWIDATFDMTSNNPPDIGAGSIAKAEYNSTTGLFNAILLGVQEGTESPPSRFAPYFAINSTAVINKVMAPIDWHKDKETPNQLFRIQFAHKTMTLDKPQMRKIYEAWKLAVDDVKGVEGLAPALVLNIVSKSTMTVAKQNGIGNTWGLDDSEDLMSESGLSSPPPLAHKTLAGVDFS
ncbi:putative fad binding domain-containing protein [Diplocarpon rosae]|nr:putative fad binding domain-containing protein [Diplocarpon rosae]